MPLNDARRALTRAFDLLVMGAVGVIVGEVYPSKPSVRVESPWAVQGDGVAAVGADGIKSFWGKTFLER